MMPVRRSVSRSSKPPASEVVKFERFLSTLCRHKGRLLCLAQVASAKPLMPQKAAFIYYACEKSGLAKPKGPAPRFMPDYYGIISFTPTGSRFGSGIRVRLASQMTFHFDWSL